MNKTMSKADKIRLALGTLLSLALLTLAVKA